MRKFREILTEQQIQAGLDLEDDEDFVYLYCGKEKSPIIFSSLGATAESLRAEAEKLKEEPG